MAACQSDRDTLSGRWQRNTNSVNQLNLFYVFIDRSNVIHVTVVHSFNCILQIDLCYANAADSMRQVRGQAQSLGSEKNKYSQK